MAPYLKMPKCFPKDRNILLFGHCSILSGDSVMSLEHGSPVQNSISDSAAAALLLPLLSNAPLPSSSIFYQACTFEECNSPLNFYLLFAWMHSFICLFVGVYACAYVWGCGHARAPMWRPEDNLQKLGLSFQRVGPRNWTPVKLPLLSAPLEFARSLVCASVSLCAIELLLSYPESGMGGSVPSLRITSGGPQLSVPHLPGECVLFTQCLV